LLLGCRPHDPIDYEISIYSAGQQWPRSANATMHYDDKTLAIDKGKYGGPVLHLTLESGKPFDIAKLRVELDTPCGVTRVPLKYMTEGDEKFVRSQEGHARKGQSVLVSVTEPAASSLMVHVDRRAAGDVRLGKMDLPKGKGVQDPTWPGQVPDADLYEVVMPDCDEGRKVIVDGREVGDLGLKIRGDVPHAVIDPDGTHCYDRAVVGYEPIGPRIQPFGYSAPKPVRETGAYVHVFLNGPPYADTRRAFASCPFSIQLRSGCAEMRPVKCDDKPPQY
jgi:hypothetical protein